MGDSVGFRSLVGRFLGRCVGGSGSNSIILFFIRLLYV